MPSYHPGRIWGQSSFLSNGYRGSCLGLKGDKDKLITTHSNCVQRSKIVDLYIRRMVSSGMLRRVVLVRTDVSEEHSASFIRVTRIGELGTTLAVTSNRRTLRRHTCLAPRCRLTFPNTVALKTRLDQLLRSATIHVTSEPH
jgi:hypothetical protein